MSLYTLLFDFTTTTTTTTITTELHGLKNVSVGIYLSDTVSSLSDTAGTCQARYVP